jgi:hypothetical protein
VPRFHGAVAQVGRDVDVEIGDLHNRVLSTFDDLSRQIRRGEAGLRVGAGTYATAPHELDTSWPRHWFFLATARAASEWPSCRGRSTILATRGSLIDAGVDGLITDYPDRLRGVFASRGEVAEAGLLLRLPTVIDTTYVIWRSSDLHSDARVQFEVGGTR